jgi:hypothetical protein
MSETEQAAEAVADEEVAPEGTVAVAETVEAEPVQESEETAQEPVAEAVAEPAAEPVEEAAPARVGQAPAREAKILLCERGHRTVALWSTPSHCHARPTRSGPECGRQLYPIGELPEQVQKALNPLKASKKASKG